VSAKNIRIGEEVLFRIVLYTHGGQPKTTGGDLLKVVIFNVDKGAYSPGRVLDFRNGTYLAIVDALWEGDATVQAYISYTTQAITAMYRMRNEVGSTDKRFPQTSVHQNEKKIRGRQSCSMCA